MTREHDRIQENANKCVVKNCPAFDSKYNECHSKIEPHKLYCQDCTNCVIKQVIEKCKENLSSLETYIDIRSYECTMLQDILQLFDIEEINK